MAVREILRMGDARLLRRAQPVGDVADPRIAALIRDLFDTMQAADGAGLAAPQIGVDLRVVVFGTGAIVPRYPEAPPVPRTVLVNPVLEPIGPETESDWEGCLSVPGLRGRVSRHLHLRYRGIDPQGRRIDRTVSGFHARVVQHECDHLDGILYPMRVVDFREFGFTDVLFPAGSAASAGSSGDD